jgi:hypothetical protein
MYSLLHHHSGVEAVYVIQGEACFDTPTPAFRLQKGETLALPTGLRRYRMLSGMIRHDQKKHGSSQVDGRIL